MNNLLGFTKNLKHKHYDKGVIDYKPYPFQENVLKRIEHREHYIISKARNMGITTTLLIFSLFKLLQKKDVCYISPSEAMSSDTQNIFRDIIHNSNLSGHIRRERKSEIDMTNGSHMKFYSSRIFEPVHSTANDFKRWDVIIIDEAAWIKHGREIEKFVKYSIKDEHHIILTSTPNSTEKWFDTIFMRALRAQNSFIPMQLDWTLHPDHDQDWRIEQGHSLGEDNAIVMYDGTVKEIRR